jgi:hypothetical protein
MDKGGVCILIKKNHEYNPIDVSSFCIQGICEMAAAKILVGSSHITVVCVYRSPSDLISVTDQFLDSLNNCLESVLRRHSDIIVAGDFNIDLSIVDRSSKRLIDLMSSFGLRSTVFSYTREFKGSKSLIDNVFTNVSPSLFQSSVLVTGVSDHHAQISELRTSSPVFVNQPKYTLSRSFSNKNITLLKSLLKMEDWSTLYALPLDINIQFEHFLSIVSYYLDLSCPIKRTKLIKKKSLTKISLNDNLLKLREKQLFLYSLTKDLPLSHPLRQAYRRTKNEFRSQIHLSRASAIRDRIDKASNKSKVSWEVIKDVTPNKSETSFSPIEIIDDENKLNSDPYEVSESFNAFFSSVAERLNCSNTSCSTTTISGNATSTSFLFFSPTSREEVFKTIKSLKTSKSSSLDCISSKLLQFCAEELTIPLTHLANSSFEQGAFPDVLKISKVKPLHKKGNKQDRNNFRPITIPSTFSKVLEKLVLNRLSSYLNLNNILFDKQFGFREGSSTTNAIYSLSNEISKALDDGQHSIGLFLDLSKAFDVVDHGILLRKLTDIGVGFKAFDWIASFLSNRMQIVEIPFVDNGCLKNKFSNTALVKTGVPQGSVIGPILFLIFINDIHKSLTKGHLCLFADDTSLIISSNEQSRLEVDAFIQGSSLLQWLAENSLCVNTLKTKLVQFQLRQSSETHEASTFFIGEEVINFSDSVDYLGLTIDSKLNFSMQVDKVVKKLSSGIFVLRRLSNFVDQNVLLTVYYGCIYPHLTYGVAVWGLESSQTHRLFRSQKKAVRAIFGMRFGKSCRTVFRHNNILTFPCIYILESLMFFKRNPTLFQLQQSSHSYSLRHRFNHPLPRHKTTFFSKQMQTSCIRLFNALPLGLKVEPRINIFKRELKAFLIKKEYYSVADYFTDRG